MPEGSELSGWGAIATYLGVSERSAQEYERKHGLPVHRMPGLRGRFWALPGEIDSWKRADDGTPRNGVAKSSRRWLWATGGLFLVAAGGVAVVSRVRRSAELCPVRATVEGPVTRVFNSSGSELWRVVAPDGMAPTTLFPPLLHDLDSDGNPELLIRLAFTAEHREVNCPFQVYDHRGRLVWSWYEDAPVPDGRSLDGPPWLSSAFTVLRRPGVPAAWVVLASISKWGSTSTIVLLDSAGNVRGRYFHRGHLLAVAGVDVDGDGQPEILAAGVSDAPDRNRATLVVLDPARLAGASGAWRAPGKLDYPAASVANEKQVLFFGRSRLSRDEQFNIACHIQAERDRVSVSVEEASACGVGRNFVYHFDRRLALMQVQVVDSSRVLLRELEQQGLAPRGAADAESTRLASLLEVYRPSSGAERRE